MSPTSLLMTVAFAEHQLQFDEASNLAFGPTETSYTRVVAERPLAGELEQIFSCRKASRNE
jgi:hypothetical protein